MRIFLLALFFLYPLVLQAQIRWSESVMVQFATVEEGAQTLMRRDDFVERMSPFDRAARMKLGRDVSEQEYLQFVARNVLAWSQLEQTHVTSALNDVQVFVEKHALPLPPSILLIKTTGFEEGGAAYTRANAIVLPQSRLSGSLANLQKTIFHELFHVMSRANPNLREELYGAIGFTKCQELEWPPEIGPRITNPDAPKNDHSLRIQVQGQEHWAVPIIFSSESKYDAERGGEFFRYLQFKFLLIEKEADGLAIKPLYEADKPRLLGKEQVTGFFEQVGNNTQYIIHPEEILADNFALLATGQTDVASPEILAKMIQVLDRHTRQKSAVGN